MKKLLLFAIVTSLTAFAASAQPKKPMPASNAKPATAPESRTMAMSSDSPTGKGKWLLGASIGMSSLKDDNGNSSSLSSGISFQPGLSYFIKDDLALGLILGLGSTKEEIDNVVTNKRSSFFIAPVARYYLPISDRFKFFGQLMIPVGTRKTTISNSADVDFKIQDMSVQLMPGFSFFPSKKISIEMGLGVIYFQSGKFEGEKLNGMGIAVLGENIIGDSSGDDVNFAKLGFKFHLGK